MASRAFSNLLVSGRGRSFYEELRAKYSNVDPEAGVGLLDEENLSHQFQDYDLEHAEGLGVDDSHTTHGSAAHKTGRVHAGRRDTKARWLAQEEDADNDVPASLLVENHEVETSGKTNPTPSALQHPRAAAVSGPSTGTSGMRWEEAQTEPRLHHEDTFDALRRNYGTNTFTAGVIGGNSKQKAEWRWANVSNLDIFIKDVYDYYQGCGIRCILLERFLHLL
jgi:autophagy-related protein 9